MSYQDYLRANLPVMRHATPATAPVDPRSDPRFAASVIAKALANQAARAPLPQANYNGGGAPVVANDIIGQRGPVVTGPPLAPPPNYGQPNGPIGPAYVPPPPPPYNISGAPGENRTGGTPLDYYQFERGRTTSVQDGPGLRNPLPGEQPATGIPLSEAVTDVVTHPLDTASDVAKFGVETAVGKPLALVDQYVPYGDKVIDALNAAYEWNTGRIGGDMYEVATGEGSVADWPIYNVDTNAAHWAADNKEKVKVLYETGLDLNEDGVVDIKGGDAVYMAYMTEAHPNFIDQMIVQMGADPLFAASFVVPVAGGIREGTAVGAEAAAMSGAAKTAVILRAIEKAMGVVETAGEVGNKIQEAPITLPAAAIRRGVGMANSSGVGRKIGWLFDDAPATVERKVLNEAADTADAAQLARPIPTYQTDGITNPGGVKLNPDMLPERSVTNPPDYMDTPYGVAPTSPQMTHPNLAHPSLPERSTTADFVVDADGQVVSRGPEAPPHPYSGEGVVDEADVAAREAAQAETAAQEVPVRRSNADGIPTTYVGKERDVRVRQRNDGVYEVQTKESYGKTGSLRRWKADEGFGSEAEAVERGKNVVKERSAGVESPPPERQIATRGMTREQINQAIKDPTNPITQLTPVPGGPRLIDQAWDRGDVNPAGWETFNTTYTPKAIAYKEKAAGIEGRYYPDFNNKIVDQTLASIEHVVRDVTPAFKESYGDVPEAIPLGRKVAETKSGKASFRNENLPYLYQRYVYESSERSAAKLLETIRKRSEIKNAPWSEKTIERLTDLRNEYNAIRPQDVRPGPGVVGAFAPGTAEYQALLQKVDDLTNQLLGNPEPQAARQLADPDFAVNDMGAHERFTLANDIAIQAARGEIPEATARALATPLKRVRVKATSKGISKTGKWRTSSEEEVAEMLKQTTLTPEESAKFIQTEEMNQLDLLQDVMERYPDLSAAEVSAKFADEVADITGARVAGRPQLASTIQRSRLARGLSAVNQSGRSIALHNPLNFVRRVTSDALSDGLRAYYEGHGVAGMKALNPVEYTKQFRGAETELQRIAKTAEMDLPQDLRPKFGRSEILVNGRTPTNKMVSGALGVKEGSTADRIIGAGTGIIDSKTGALIINANDNVRREAIFLSELEKRQGQAGRTFRQRARTFGEQHGILPSSVDAYLAEVFDAAELPSARSIRESMTELAHDANIPADQAVNFGDRLGRDWKHSLSKMFKAADDEQKRVYFTYERKNIDQLLGNVIFYHYWMTRAIPAYAKIALRNPEIAASWVRAWNEVGRRAEEDGQPDSLFGYIRTMGSMAGFYGSVNPWNVILPIADLRPDAEAHGTWDKMTQFLFVSPLIQAAASVIGADESVVDPLNTYATRNMAMAILNDVRASRGETPMLDDPYEQLLRAGFELANQIVAQPGTPFREQDFLDPKAFTQTTIRAVVMTVIEEQTNIPKEEWGPEQWEMWRSAVADGESGIVNPTYQEAYEQWADANLQGRVMNSLVPGGYRTRYGPKDELLAGDLTDEEKNVKGMLNSGSMEDAHLDILNDEYFAIGTDRQQAFANTYNEIVGVDLTGAYDNGDVITIGGNQYTKTQLAKLEEEDRKTLADQWVAEEGGTDELKDYRDERKKFVEANPEFGDFKNWQSTAYNYEGGLHQFRLDRAKGNPNFKVAMDEHETYLRETKGIRDKDVLEHEMDQWAASLGAYKSAYAIKDYVYDSDPISTGDQSTVDSIVRTIGSGSGGSSSGKSSGSSSKKTYVEKLTDSITKYDKDMAVVTDLLAQYGMDPALLESNNPYVEDAIKGLVGDLMPYKSTLQKQYELWKTIQIANGADDSVAAFGRYMDELEKREAAA